jgi:hypothetical protein
MRFVHSAQAGDSIFMLKAIARNSRVMGLLDEEHCKKHLVLRPPRADLEFVMLAVQLNGMALQGVSDELRGDREVVLAAVRQNGNALQYASIRLRGDKKVALEAVSQRGHAFQHATAKVRHDRKTVLAALYRDPSAMQHTSEKNRYGINACILSTVKSDLANGEDRLCIPYANPNWAPLLENNTGMKDRRALSETDIGFGGRYTSFSPQQKDQVLTKLSRQWKMPQKRAPREDLQERATTAPASY